MAGEVSICEGGRGNFFPLTTSEQDWPKPLRQVLYFVGLVWCFLGVAIISDVFMGAIERITSKKRRVQHPQTGRYITVAVWNETVANLTLMALGSSAPEILLSVIELVGNHFYSGELGPSTIVGSAAFNLMCISAVCICAIPDGEVRKIKDVPVYVVTATCSVGAYVWLIFILGTTSADVVDIWEGFLTLFFFPLLITVAYAADQGYLSTSSTAQPIRLNQVMHAEISTEELAQMEQRIREEHGPNLTDEQVMKILEVEHFSHRSRAYYRVGATRAVTGGRRVSMRPMDSDADLQGVIPTRTLSADKVSHAVSTHDDLKDKETVIGFCMAKVAILESRGQVTVPLQRLGNTKRAVTVDYKTKEGSAKEHSDYEPVAGTIEFAEGEIEKSVTVKIIDDFAFEDDEEFYIELSEPKDKAGSNLVRLSDISMATVLIIDDDLPGHLRFQSETIEVLESKEDQTVDIVVERFNGASGKVGCKFYTEGDSAVAGHDFMQASGKLEFETGQMTTTIPVKIKAVGRYDSREMFRVILTEPFGGARFDKDSDGGEGSCILSVVIKADPVSRGRLESMRSRLDAEWNKMKIGHTNWAEQFQAALYPGGGDDEDEEDEEEAGLRSKALMYVMHFISLPWKLLFAFVPPTDYCDGWVCFICSLLMIGLVTAAVGDLAALLGCVLGVPDSITAITFVALGTSLPDTFASKAAAVMDPSADASIGNVTGSNSVNVFLGLGIPWLMGSIYWSHVGATDEWKLRNRDVGTVVADYPNGAFVVEAGGLSFSVAVFSACALCTIVLLAIRRVVFGGELGGPAPMTYVSSAFLVLLWFFYIGMSSWYAVNEQ